MPTPPVDREQSSVSSRAILATGVAVVVATLCVKVFEVVKNILSVSKFGITPEADIYNVALGVPETLVVVLGLDTLRGAATTFFTEYVANKESDKLRQVVSAFISWGILLSTLLVICATVFMPQIVWLLANGFTGDRLNMTIMLGYLVLPVLFLRVFVGLFVSLLNAHNVFARVTLFPLIASIPGIIVLLFSDFQHLLWNMSLTYMLAYVVYVVWLAAYTRRFVRWTLSFRAVPPQFWEILKFSGMLVFATGASQIAAIVERRTASFFPDGTIASLNSAYLLAGQFVMIVVFSLFGVIQRQLTATLATVDVERAVKELWNILARLLFVVMFGVAVLAVLRVPILRFLYKRQLFDEVAVARTAAPLFIYSFWIVGQTLTLTMTTLLLAMKKSRVIVVCSVLAYGTNALLVGVFAAQWGYLGIAASTVFGSALYALLLFGGMRRTVGAGAWQDSGVVFRLIFAGVITAWGMYAVLTLATGASMLVNATPWLQICLVGSVGAGIYLGVCSLARVNYARPIMVELRGRFRWGR